MSTPSQAVALREAANPPPGGRRHTPPPYRGAAKGGVSKDAVPLKPEAKTFYNTPARREVTVVIQMQDHPINNGLLRFARNDGIGGNIAAGFIPIRFN